MEAAQAGPVSDLPAALRWGPVVMAGSAILTAGVLAGVDWLSLLAVVVYEGGPALLNVAAATLAGLAVSRRLAPGMATGLQIASGAALGVGVLATAALLLGLAGWLNTATGWGVVGVLLVIGAADAAMHLRNGGAARNRLLRRARQAAAEWPVSVWPVAAIGLGVVAGVGVVAAALPAGLLWDHEPLGYDVSSYHLQVPREWFELGRVVPLEHNVFSHMPLATEAVFLLQMHQLGGPWSAMYAAHYLNLLLVGLFVAGVYGAAREGGSHRGALVAAVLAATAPWTVMLGSVAYNEPLVMLAGVSATGLLLRSVRLTFEASGDGQADRRIGGGGRGEAAVAGLCAGVAVAAKYPAVAMVVAAGCIGIVALVVVRARGPSQRETRGATTRLGAIALVFLVLSGVFASPWLVRNLAWTGNPVFPLATSVFGRAHWDETRHERWAAAHAVAEGHSRSGQLVGEVLLNPRFGWILWAAALVGGVTAWRGSVGGGAAGAGERSPRDTADGRRAVIVVSAMLLAMLLVWLFFTHLQGRFLVYAMAPALMLAAMAFYRPAMATAVIVVAGLLGSSYTALQLVPLLAEGRAQPSQQRQPVLGVTWLWFATPFEDPDVTRGRTVHLVGDARAFSYPAERVSYRVVFDVPPVEGAIRAWLGEDLVHSPATDLVVIDLAEIERLHEHYGTPLLEVDETALRRVAAGEDGKQIWLEMRHLRELLAGSGQATPQHSGGRDWGD